ncbi:hypothetical protein PFISCL1PPCAC_26896, partial [Pristionchus fissidentatus]
IVQEGIVQEGIIQEAEVESTTGTSLLTGSASPSTVYNLNANANSESSPKIANVVAPIAGIVDSISPLLLPLLGGQGGAARARGVP